MTNAAGRPRLPLRLTGRGVGLLVLAPGVIFTGLMFGVADFVALGTALIAVVLVGVVLAALVPRDLQLVRSGPRDELRDGQTALVVYDLRAGRLGIWPVRGTADLLERRGRAPEPLTITGVRLNRPTAVRFEALPRGLYGLGPGWILRSDPMGVAQRIQDLPGKEVLHVWPSTVPIAAPLLPGLAEAGQPAPVSEGYEFRQLREFVSGDDRRRIHWPSSAKRGTLLVRETQDDESERVRIVLDCRVDSYRDAEAERDGVIRNVAYPGFELAVSVAASLVESYARAGVECSLALTAQGRPEVDIADSTALGRALDLLAGAAVDSVVLGTDVVDALVPDRNSRTRALVLVGGKADTAIADGLQRARAARRSRVAILCDEAGSAMHQPDVAAAWVTPAGPGRRVLISSLEQLADALGAAAGEGTR
ncbi:MAG: DUF58 domain-containing protein [Acidimicrobiia bacterium]|nr:DUF58 domain-containing protein [Acidimicrobiia bacterium]